MLKIDWCHRKACNSISVSSQCTKSVILLLHLVMALDFSPKEFVHVPRNPNLKWIWTGGESYPPIPDRTSIKFDLMFSGLKGCENYL